MIVNSAVPDSRLPLPVPQLSDQSSDTIYRFRAPSVSAARCWLSKLALALQDHQAAPPENLISFEWADTFVSAPTSHHGLLLQMVTCTSPRAGLVMKMVTCTSSRAGVTGGDSHLTTCWSGDTDGDWHLTMCCCYITGGDYSACLQAVVSATSHLLLRFPYFDVDMNLLLMCSWLECSSFTALTQYFMKPFLFKGQLKWNFSILLIGLFKSCSLSQIGELEHLRKYFREKDLS